MIFLLNKIRQLFAELFFIGASVALALAVTANLDWSFTHPVALCTWGFSGLFVLAIAKGFMSPPPNSSAPSNDQQTNSNDTDDNHHNIVFRGSGYPFTDINTPDD